MGMARTRSFVWVACILACCPCVLAQDSSVEISQYAHTAWTAQDGWFRDILAIAQTPDGYLWLGTSFGLLRFDGVRFTEWKPPQGDSIPYPPIGRLLGSSDGSLWMGGYFGLAQWKDGRLRRFHDF